MTGRAGITMTSLEAIDATRALFVQAMMTAPAAEPETIGRRGSMTVRWPRGSVGWWNERIRACDELRSTYEDQVAADALPNRAWELVT